MYLKNTIIDPHWAYSYYPTKEGLAVADRYKTGNLLLKESNISGKDFPIHPLMGAYSSLPLYLTLTNVPYVTSEFSLDSTYQLYRNTYRKIELAQKRPDDDPHKAYYYYSSLPYCYYSYTNSLTDLEEVLEANEQLECLKTMRERDYLSRMSIINSDPVYGKDLRKAVKVQLLVTNLYQKPVKYCTGEVPSTVLNSLANSETTKGSACTCEDIDNNDIPKDCEIVLECVNKKIEKRKPKKIPSFKFDPNKGPEFQKLMEEYANEEKKLVVTIDLEFLYGRVNNPYAEISMEGSSTPVKEDKAILVNDNIEELKDDSVKQVEDNKEVVVKEKAEEEYKEKLTEELKEEDKMSIEEGRVGDSLPSENNLSDSNRQQDSMSDISSGQESEISEDEKQGIGRYLTRSRQRALQNKTEVTVPYNGVNVELIPIRFIELIDHQNENPIEDVEETKENLLTEEELKADQDKFFAYRYTEAIKDLIKQPNQRQKEMAAMLRHFKVIQPKALGLGVKLWPSSYSTIYRNEDSFFTVAYRRLMNTPFVQRALRIANFLTFPDRKLIQYDSGKLQKMSLLLKRLRSQNSKVLIFTQMSKMLDIIESFLNLHGYTYVRLDGSIKVETRQTIVDRFNNDPRILCFISSTRCGGIGINLTAADAVIFYDSDWNPAMDKQAQDRCHRIGQTKTVHIYRFITLNTIEENIFKKSLQKREIGGLIMEDGQFDTEFFKKIDFKEVVEEERLIKRPKNILEKENIRIDSMKDDDKGKDDIEDNPELIKKLEDALIVVEDKEDVEAAENAKKEIVDEFEFSEDEEQQPAEVVHSKPVPKRREETEFKKNELIDWENDESLLIITKKSLEFYKNQYSYEEFHSAYSATDKRFIPEVSKEEEESSESVSESVISDTECDELPASVKLEALQAYEETKRLLQQMNE